MLLASRCAILGVRNRLHVATGRDLGSYVVFPKFVCILFLYRHRTKGAMMRCDVATPVAAAQDGAPRGELAVGQKRHSRVPAHHQPAHSHEVTESALARTVTIQGGRYRKQVGFLIVNVLVVNCPFPLLRKQHVLYILKSLCSVKKCRINPRSVLF